MTFKIKLSYIHFKISFFFRCEQSGFRERDFKRKVYNIQQTPNDDKSSHGLLGQVN